MGEGLERVALARGMVVTMSGEGDEPRPSACGPRQPAQAADERERIVTFERKIDEHDVGSEPRHEPDRIGQRSRGDLRAVPLEHHAEQIAGVHVVGRKQHVRALEGAGTTAHRECAEEARRTTMAAPEHGTECGGICGAPHVQPV